MVDYDKASGLGTLRIRDLGSNIEFWAKPYYSDFWWDNLHFTSTTTASTNNHYVDFSGNSWVKVTTRTVSTSQTVTFKLVTATGTSSLGGPTTHSVYIDRATVPPAPDAPTVSNKTDTTMTVAFTNNGNGGDALDNWAIALSTTTTPSTTYYVGSDQRQDFTGLVPGQLYYMWSRVHNSKGWSGWSARTHTQMLRVPFAPTNLSLSNVEQQSLDMSFTDGNNGGAAVTSRQIAYNTSNTLTGATIISSDGSTHISGLLPGRRYYFWARTNNIIGNGNWSSAITTELIAGATITVGGVVKRAVPWVNDGGVWKVARPWVKAAGFWIESTK